MTDSLTIQFNSEPTPKKARISKLSAPEKTLNEEYSACITPQYTLSDKVLGKGKYSHAIMLCQNSLVDKWSCDRILKVSIKEEKTRHRLTYNLFRYRKEKSVQNAFYNARLSPKVYNLNTDCIYRERGGTSHYLIIMDRVYGQSLLEYMRSKGEYLNFDKVNECIEGVLRTMCENRLRHQDFHVNNIFIKESKTTGQISAELIDFDRAQSDTDCDTDAERNVLLRSLTIYLLTYKQEITKKAEYRVMQLKQLIEDGITKRAHLPVSTGVDVYFRLVDQELERLKSVFNGEFEEFRKARMIELKQVSD